MLCSQEYANARKAANAGNHNRHKEDPSTRGIDIYEINSVKYGGGPTDDANKVPLTRSKHSQYKKFLNNLQRMMKEANK